MDNKVLVLDIETAPMLAYVWGLHDQEIALNQIKQDWYVLAWGAKWLNRPASEIIYQDQRNKRNPTDDRALLTELWSLLDRADIVITQNGERFDGPKLNARFILHGMKSPSPYRHLDTYKIVKQVAEFTSNKLEYLTDKLCVKYKKITHGKFPGMTLWKECMKNNLIAWEEMRRYNTHDVLSTEELYNKIRAWAPARMPLVYHTPANSTNCGICGKQTLERSGHKVLKTGVFQRYHCTNCGAWSKGEKIKGDK